MRLRTICVALTLALSGAACGGTPGIGGTARNGEPTLTAVLNGSGATFPKAYYEVAVEAYRTVQPRVTVNYEGVGSGAGRQKLQDGVVDFAGSDAPVPAADLPRYEGEILYFPTVAAPITVAYNLPGVRDLQLDAETIARIFQRQITTWNDPAIAALNRGARLPDEPITVARRSDGSGTTQNFAQYLALAAPGVWSLKPGSTVEWPTGTQAGNGNAGVAQIVKTTRGAVGYVDLSDAKATGLKAARVKNKAGRFVAATTGGAEAALAASQLDANLLYNPLDAGGEAAYPLTAPTWILAYKVQTDRAKGEALRSFLRYTLGDEAQELAAEVDFARLPPAMQQKALAQVDALVLPAT